MNEYTAQTIARQRMEETARNTRYAYRTTRPQRRFQIPQVSWSFRHHTPFTAAPQE